MKTNSRDARHLARCALRRSLDIFSVCSSYTYIPGGGRLLMRDGVCDFYCMLKVQRPRALQHVGTPYFHLCSLRCAAGDR